MTSHHPAREGIERELRSLRKAYGPLDDIKLATASFIVRALGNHDVGVALTRLVDPRTVRRWSDAGIKKLTQLIIGAAPWIQPRARQLLVAREDAGTSIVMLRPGGSTA